MAIAFIEAKSDTQADGSGGVTVTFDTPLSAGDSVHALLSYEDTALLSVNPTLIDGGAAELVQSVQSVGTGLVSEIWFVNNVTGGETGLSFATDSGVRANLQVLVFSGMANAAEENAQVDARNDANIAVSGIDATSDNNLCIAVFTYNSDSSLYDSGPTNSFTRVGTGTGGTGTATDIYQECVYRIRAADHAAIAVSITISSAQEYAAAGAAYGEAGGGGGKPAQYYQMMRNG